MIDDATGDIAYACPESSPGTAVGEYSVNSTTSTTTCYWTSNGSINDRVCLPSDGCFRFVAGQENPVGQRTALKVTYGGEILKVTDNLSFESLKLFSTSTGRCSNIATCQIDNDKDVSSSTELELFIVYGIWDQNVNEDISLANRSWYVGDLTTGSHTKVDLNDRDRIFVYHRQCITGCASTRVQNLFGPIASRIRAGGITYGLVDPTLSFEESTALVGNCSPKDHCDGEPLLQVDINLTDEVISPESVLDNWGEFIHFSNDGISVRDWNPVDAFNGEHVRYLLCFPAKYGNVKNEQCWACATMSSSYSYKMQGVDESEPKIITDRIDCNNPTKEFKSICENTYVATTLIPLTGMDSCKSKRSLKLIISLVTISIVILLIVVGGYVYIQRRRRRRNFTDGTIAVVAIPIGTDLTGTLREENPQGSFESNLKMKVDKL